MSYYLKCSSARGCVSHQFIWYNIGDQSGSHLSISLEVGLLAQADWQGAAGAALVCFGVPPVEGICCCCGVCMEGGGLFGVFVVAVGAACCGVAGAVGAAGGFADGACSKDSGVAGTTSAVVDVPCLTASR